MHYTESRAGRASVQRLAFFLLLCFWMTTRARAQDGPIGAIRVSIDVKDRPFREVLTLVEAQLPARFAYSTDLVRSQGNVTLKVNNMALTSLLVLLLQNTQLAYTVIGNEIVLRDRSPATKTTLSGYIKDSRNGELLIGASIYVPQLQGGTLSNSYGFYSITLPPFDTLTVEVSYVGYKSQTLRLSSAGSPNLTLSLERNQGQESINGLTIANDKREENFKKNQSALVDLSDNMLMTAPSLSGSGDVINSIQMLPGVQAGLEGSPGYSVRGGNTGQNLVLLDEATLYNPSHVFGLVSIFNGPAIRNATLMKGSFPASYGDHISSVLDIAMKDGNKQQFGGAVLLSPIASGVTLYGPLQTGKSSFLVAARRSALDWWLHPIADHNYFSNYYFYDLNAKASCWLSPSDRLLFSFYRGRDNNAYYTAPSDSSGIDYSMHFGNQALSVRWNHLFSSRLFTNTSVVYNRYHQFLSANQDGYFAQLYSGIRDVNVKTDISWYPTPGDRISGGVNYLWQTLYPASVSANTASADSGLVIDPKQIPEKNSIRLAAYLSDDMRLSQRFSLYAGVRMPFYYKQDVQYLNIEPRLSALWMTGATSSIKASYTLMHQYIHLVQSYNASFPAEIWIGSSAIVQPQAGHQFTAGFYNNFKENTFQASLEGYYKTMSRQLLFKGGTTPTIDNSIESQLIFGRGYSYGAELLLRKNRGRLTGWLSYSLAYAWQQFDSLNSGNPFPFAFDRRHSLHLAAAYEIDPHWRVSADFCMTSGRAFTLTAKRDSTAANPGGSNPLFEEDDDNGGAASSAATPENNYRLSPYNRLDLGISYRKQKILHRRTLEAEWALTVYNVYARNNTSFAYRTIDPVSGQVVAREVSLIPVIPTLTYSLRF